MVNNTTQVAQTRFHLIVQVAQRGEKQSNEERDKNNESKRYICRLMLRNIGKRVKMHGNLPLSLGLSPHMCDLL